MTTPDTTSFSAFQSSVRNAPLPKLRHQIFIDQVARLRARLTDPERVEWNEATSVLTWRSNGRPVADFVLESDAHLAAWPEQVEAHEAEEQAALASYRAASAPASAEERFELNAAFGPGATVVDVFSGRRTTL